MQENVMEMKDEVIEKLQNDFSEWEFEIISIFGNTVRENIFDFYLRETIIEIFKEEKFAAWIIEEYWCASISLADIVCFFYENEKYFDVGRKALKKLIKDYAKYSKDNDPCP